MTCYGSSVSRGRVRKQFGQGRLNNIHLLNRWAARKLNCKKIKTMETPGAIHLTFRVGYANVKLVPRSGGDTHVSTAKYINILQRQEEGSWLTTHNTWNANDDAQ
jgi:hypothetical protein